MRVWRDGLDRDAGVNGSGVQRGVQVARVQALFPAEAEGSGIRREGGQQEIARLAGGVSFQNLLRLDRDGVAAAVADSLEKRRVEFKRQVREGLQRGRVVRVVRRQHTGGGAAGQAGVVAVQHDDVPSSQAEFQSEGKADDAGSGDDDVGVLHCVHGTGMRAMAVAGRCRTRETGRVAAAAAQELRMLEPDPDRVYVDPSRGSSERHGAWLPIATATALVLAIGALLWAFLLQQRLTDTEEKLALAEQGSSAFSRRLAEADAKIRANSATVDQQLTVAEQKQQELAERAASLAAQQKSDAARLAASQADTTKQLGAVKGEVSTVRTDVASTRTDVAATRTDLADTKLILQRTVGDAGVLSGLIARNHDDLEVLRHRGDRSYYEFTLHKNAPPALMSTVKLQLKKANEKKGRYTLVVSSDDRNIEKKDKTVLEPVQFYSGKDPQLFEVVVNNIAKDVVTGYLSVPKGQ